MAEGMEVEATPAIRDKKRFEVKKVSIVLAAACDVLINAPYSLPFLVSLRCSGMPWHCGHGVSISFRQLHPC